MRDNLVFYRSFAEAIECLPEEDQLDALWNIINYALNDEEPSGSGAAMAVFKMAKPQIDTNNKRYENALKGGETTRAKMGPSGSQPKAKMGPSGSQSGAKVKPNDNVNDNDNVNVNDIKESRRNKFAPPTSEQVKEYAEEKGYAIDAERFVDFYQSKGWKVGKDSMKDWKAAVRNWARSEKPARKEETTKPKKNIVNDFDQREYDYDELERQLLQRTYGGE